jgi:hypothetical protein
MGASEQRAISAEVCVFRVRAIDRRFSRNHSGEGSTGRCFVSRKNRLAFLETNARNIVGSNKDDYPSRLAREHFWSAFANIVCKISSHSEIPKHEALIALSSFQLVDPVEGLPFTRRAAGPQTHDD